MARLQNFRLKVILRRVSPKFAALCCVCTVVFYNEVFSFFVSSWQWPNLSSSNEDNLRVLFVADPQLVGLRDELPLLGVVTRWDADKYLQFGFFRAVSYVRPDIVVFLGDLLDEGSKASDDEYATYIRRFRNVFRMPTTARSIFVSGDNDVGGEGFDTKQQWKVDRFGKHFEHSNAANYSIGVSAIKHVNFQRISLDYGEHVSQSHIKIFSDIRSHSTARYRITCNHMPLLNRLPVEVSKITDILQPHLLVTAHTHKFQVYRCKDCKAQRPSPNLKRLQSYWSGQPIDLSHLPRPLSFNLSDTLQLYELVIPTCSYRMGVPNMGYGAAVIDTNGQMKFDILWLPSRYRQLVLYVIMIPFVALCLSMSNLSRRFKMLIMNI